MVLKSAATKALVAMMAMLALALNVFDQNGANAQQPAVYQGPSALRETQQNWDRVYGFAPFSALEAMAIACDAGVTKACAEQTDPTYSAQTDKALRQAHTFVNAGCTLGSGEACFTFAAWLELGIVRKEVRTAIVMYRKSCEVGFLPGCHRFATMNWVDKNAVTPEAAATLTKVCEGGYAIGCWTYAQAFVLTRQNDAMQDFGDTPTALRLSVQGCDGESMLASDNACEGILGVMMIAAENGQTDVVHQQAGSLGARARTQFEAGVAWFMRRPYDPRVVSLLDQLKSDGIVIRNRANVAAAAESGSIEYFPHLLGNEGDIDAPLEDNTSPLMIAAGRGTPRVISYFLERGADPNALNLRGATPLHSAALNGNAQGAGVLLRAGARIDVVSPRLGTPLYLAAQNLPGIGRQDIAPEMRKAKAEVARLLIEQGANPNYIHDETGETPLFGAIRNEHDDLANMLLDAGADPNVIAKNGTTPRQLFRQVEAKRAEEARLAEQQRLARIEAERQAALARQQQAQKKQGGGLLGSVLGMATGAVIGSELGLPADTLADFAGTMGNIGRAVETGNASDAMAAQSSVDAFKARSDATLGSRLNSGSPASRLSSRTDSIAAINQRTDAAAGREGYQTEMYSFTCPSGHVANISVPYKTPRQLQLRKELARTSSCNLMDESQAVQNQCTAEFGNPYCQ
jgi:ankyrin repeat protein